MSLSAYLAKNYLTASNPTNNASELSTRPKKRRKKDLASLEPTSTLIIADDDEHLSLRTSRATNNDDDEPHPIYDHSHHSAEFRKSRQNNWQALTASATPAPASNLAANDAAAAEHILARTAASRRARAAETAHADAPAIVAARASPPTAKTSSSIRAGLQTAADTQRLESEEAAQQNAAKKARGPHGDAAPPAEETVYRDATGRRIDVGMKRAGARAAEAARGQAQREEKEAARGEVQRGERARAKDELAEARFLPVARAADDEAMNSEMKARARWEDPMAAYVLRRPAGEEGEMRVGSKAGARTRRREYGGAAPPNRYGVAPGWRWDGVDRGNGFEKEWFQARGKQARTRDLEYQWQMDE